MAPGLVEEMLSIMIDVRSAGIKPMVRALPAADLTGALGDIAVPTLLLYGERDGRAPLPVAHEIERAIPGAQLVVRPWGRPRRQPRGDRAPFDREVRRFLRGDPP